MRPSLSRSLTDRVRHAPRTGCAARVKPFNFVLTSHVSFQLIAPWTRDPRQWTKPRWVNRDGRSYAIATSETGGMGMARVKRYGEVLAEHFGHPEAKSLGPDRSACEPRTVGILNRRALIAASIAYVGKESNRLDEREAGLLSEEGEFQTTYGALREEWTWPDPAASCSDYTSVGPNDRTRPKYRQALEGGGDNPHARRRRILAAAAQDGARRATTTRG